MASSSAVRSVTKVKDVFICGRGGRRLYSIVPFVLKFWIWPFFLVFAYQTFNGFHAALSEHIRGPTL
jgi:hypothetical protein